MEGDQGPAVPCTSSGRMAACSFSQRRGIFTTKPSGAVDTIEGRDFIQRELENLEKWIHVNLMRLSKAKFKVLHLGWGYPSYERRLGEELFESNTGGKDLGFWWMKPGR